MVFASMFCVAFWKAEQKMTSFPLEDDVLERFYVDLEDTVWIIFPDFDFIELWSCALDSWTITCSLSEWISHSFPLLSSFLQLVIKLWKIDEQRFCITFSRADFMIIVLLWIIFNLLTSPKPHIWFHRLIIFLTLVGFCVATTKTLILFSLPAETCLLSCIP